MANKHMKRCSTSPIIREMQIKTAMRYHLTPIRIATIKKIEYECLQGHGEIETLVYYWWKLVQSLWKTVWCFLKSLKIELLYDPAIPLLCIYPESRVSKGYLYTHVHSSIIRNN